MLRRLMVAMVVCLALAPALPLVISALSHNSAAPVWTVAFAKSLTRSLWIGLGVSLLSFLIGLPLGLLATLYRFPAKQPLIFFQALPILLPSFLLCIGWSNLAPVKWLPTPDGQAGCIFVLGLQAVPLPFFAAWSACQNLTASQIDTARLHRGESMVFWLAARACAPAAVLAALLGGIISLSDAGAPLIFGCRSVAVEILTSFSALFDYELAGRQCLLLAGLVLLLTAPVLALGLRWLAPAVLAKQLKPLPPYHHPLLSWLAPIGLSLLLCVSIVIPTIGLCLPAVENPMFERALQKVADTAGATLMFSVGAGVVSVLLATIVALGVATDSRARWVVLAVMIGLLAMPPALAAIGVSQIATMGPPQLDWLLRSHLIVALVLGLRFLPVATLVMLRSAASMSPSWSDAARVHGVSTPRMLLRVVLPYLRTAIIVSLLLVMVLATADVTTTHLLQPPGAQSLPVAIFTVMANSPEGLVASLCLLYLSGIVLTLAAIALISGLRRSSF